ncbi:hypothetical protein ACFYR1_47300 [Streptomyces canus]|uniref:hypothetical protein n=1 Tax=Streptomyces canus TaxID=58343 RepID=UPI0036AEB854
MGTIVRLKPHGARCPDGRVVILSRRGTDMTAVFADVGLVPGAGRLAQHPSIVPIPGTRRITRVQENAGATQLPLAADELSDLDELASRIGVQGDRYNDHHMSLVNR